MLTCCNTARGRLACGFGGVLIAALALACLWAFSPAVTAGDDKPAKSGKATCPVPDLPRMPAVDKAVGDVPPLPPMAPPPPVTPRSEYSAPPPVPPLPGVSADPTPPKADSPPPAPLPPTAGSPPPPDLPPMTGSGKPAPPPAVETPPPPGPITPVGGTSPVPPPAPTPSPSADTHDIKQLVAHLSEIRADRAKLDEKERQTIQTIKKKYQEQKQALEQLERELKQLGINCDESAPLPPKAGVTDTAAPPLAR